MEVTSATTPVAQLKRDWWMFLLGGIAAFFMGWLLLQQPVPTLVSSVIFLGFYWLVAGIIDVISAIANRKEDEHTGLRIAVAILSIIAGMLIINQPLFASVITPVMFMYIVAAIFIVNGITKIFMGNEHLNEYGELYKKVSIGSVLLGVLLVISGVWLLISPTLVSVVTLVYAVGLYLLAYGIAMAILGIYIRLAKD